MHDYPYSIGRIKLSCPIVASVQLSVFIARSCSIFFRLPFPVMNCFSVFCFHEFS